MLQLKTLLYLPNVFYRIQELGFVGKDNDFSTNHGCLMRGPRVVIPRILKKKQILNILHEGHLSIIKIKTICSRPIFRGLK